MTIRFPEDPASMITKACIVDSFTYVQYHHLVVNKHKVCHCQYNGYTWSVAVWRSVSNSDPWSMCAGIARILYELEHETLSQTTFTKICRTMRWARRFIRIAAYLFSHARCFLRSQQALVQRERSFLISTGLTLLISTDFDHTAC